MLIQDKYLYYPQVIPCFLTRLTKSTAISNVTIQYFLLSLLLAYGRSICVVIANNAPNNRQISKTVPEKNKNIPMSVHYDDELNSRDVINVDERFIEYYGKYSVAILRPCVTKKCKVKVEAVANNKSDKKTANIGIENNNKTIEYSEISDYGTNDGYPNEKNITAGGDIDYDGFTEMASKPDKSNLKSDLKNILGIFLTRIRDRWNIKPGHSSENRDLNEATEAKNTDIPSSNDLDDNFPVKKDNYNRTGDVNKQLKQTLFCYWRPEAAVDKIIEKLFKKIVANLKITKLYKLSYQTNSCSSINQYLFRKKQNSNLYDYIFSENLNNFDFVVTSNLRAISKNRVRLQLMLWDILEERFIDGKFYEFETVENDATIASLANAISDFIFKITTGEKSGIFDSKIAYVAENSDGDRRNKQIAIMNFDGSENRKITDGSNIKLTPVFSRHSNEEIFYLEYLEEGPFIRKRNLKSGETTTIAAGQVMTSAATVNPDIRNNQVIVAGTETGSATNLYLFDLKKKINTKLTNNGGINTAATFSPDGNSIVYVSDRNGKRQLYRKNLKTGREIVISRGKNIYDKPSWSPDGRLISFVKIANGKFYLGLMTPDGASERYVAKAFLIEGVRWSPNSRYLLYAKQLEAAGVNAVSKIYIVDILTGNEYELNTPKNEGASDPDWIMNF